MTQNGKSISYRFLILTVFSAVSVASIIFNRQLNAIVQEKNSRSSADDEGRASFRWHPELYRILAFGHVPASVDWLLIRFLTDNNLTHAKDEKETEVFRILNLATDLDPAFYSLYTAGANFLAVARNDRNGALRLVTKGHVFLKDRLHLYPEGFQERHWPNKWRLFLIMGYIYLLEFQDVARATEAFLEMGRDPECPSGIRALASSLKTVEGQIKVALNSLAIVKRWYEEDPVMTTELERKEKILLNARSLYAWNVSFREYLARRPSTDLQKSFKSFREENRLPNRDGVGEELFLDSEGRITSKASKGFVFGLDVAKILKGNAK